MAHFILQTVVARWVTKDPEQRLVEMEWSGSGLEAFSRYLAGLLCDGLNPNLNTSREFQKLFYINCFKYDAVEYQELLPAPNWDESLRARFGAVCSKKSHTNWRRLEVFAWGWDILPIPLRYFTIEATAQYLGNAPKFAKFFTGSDDGISIQWVRKYRRILNLKAANPPVIHSYIFIDGTEKIGWNEKAKSIHKLEFPPEFTAPPGGVQKK